VSHPPWLVWLVLVGWVSVDLVIDLVGVGWWLILVDLVVGCGRDIPDCSAKFRDSLHFLKQTEKQNTLQYS
jgi:hypothetical protein